MAGYVKCRNRGIVRRTRSGHGSAPGTLAFPWGPTDLRLSEEYLNRFEEAQDAFETLLAKTSDLAELRAKVLESLTDRRLAPAR